MREQPQVSFIIPIFNTEQYLEQCLESILAQPVSKEIILINDGSSDNSLNIALKYSQLYPFITVVSSQNNGQSIARNRGISLARGKYLFFVDSDDYLLNANLDYILIAAEQHNIDVIKLQARRQTQSTDYTGPIYALPSAHETLNRNQGFVISGTECLIKMVEQYWIPAICWSLIKREFLIKNNLFFVENMRAEDQLFYIQVLTCQSDIKVLEMGNVIYHYRVRENSTMTAPTEQFFIDHFKITQLIKQWTLSKHLEGEVQRSINQIIAHIYVSALVIYQEFSEEKKAKHKNYFSAETIDWIKYYLKIGQKDK